MIAVNQVSSQPPAQTMSPLLAAEHLTITVGTGPAAPVLVQDVSLQVRSGEALGIVGESGSGKSLTARALTRLLPSGLAAAGQVAFNGISLLDTPERQMQRLRGSQLSLLLQDPFTLLNPLQTIGATITESLPPRPRRGSRAQAKTKARAEAQRRLEEVNLAPEVMGRYPFQLSGGMRQRAALAAALAKDPKLLIADEPTTALDVTTQAEILTLLRRIQQQRGMALILITHDLRLAFSVCDTIAVMYAGTVAERAPAGELAHHPAHPYSLGLLQADLPVTRYVEHIAAIPGRVPSADSVTGQCAFADRCAWTQDECVTQRPPLQPAGPARWSACLRSSDIGDEMRTQLAQQIEPATPRSATPAAGDPLVAVGQLRKTYRTSSLLGARREVVALNEVSLKVLERESVGLVGETGSGKTTIARCLLGLTRPDTGHITIAGTDATDYRKLTRRQLRQVRASVQVVFQDPYASLNPALTIATTLREALQTRPPGGPEQTVSELLDSVGLPAAYAARRPAALSGGERQRVAIARALAPRPRLLICDEPVASLDVSAQAQILELLRHLRREWQMSMLFITHDLSVVRQMAERIIVLYHGTIAEQGLTSTILDHPTHPYTQQLLGFPWEPGDIPLEGDSPMGRETQRKFDMDFREGQRPVRRRGRRQDGDGPRGRGRVHRAGAAAQGEH
jgi:peptide/nickel transport system ATP-binding protein